MKLDAHVHVASQVNGRLTPAHIAALIPWVDARGGARFGSSTQPSIGGTLRFNPSVSISMTLA
jgi:hypothetical protein